jgi:hypothetical protein
MTLSSQVHVQWSCDAQLCHGPVVGGLENHQAAHLAIVDDKGTTEVFTIYHLISTDYLDAVLRFDRALLLRDPFPPASSAFSVLLTFCFARSRFLSSFFSYRIFCAFGFNFFGGCSPADLSALFAIGTAGEVGDFDRTPSTGVKEVGSISSTTVTVATISLSSYSSCLCLPLPSDPIPVHSSSDPSSSAPTDPA